MTVSVGFCGTFKTLKLYQITQPDSYQDSEIFWLDNFKSGEHDFYVWEQMNNKNPKNISDQTFGAGKAPYEYNLLIDWSVTKFRSWYWIYDLFLLIFMVLKALLYFLYNAQGRVFFL